MTTEAEIHSEIDSQVIDNFMNLITAAIVRPVLHDIVDWAADADTFYTPEQFGVLPDETLDTYLPFALCIAAAIADSRKIMLRARVYSISQTLDFQGLFVEGTNESIIRARTNNMLMIRNGSLDTIELDGDNKALWGWLLDNTGAQATSSVRGKNVFIDQCNEWGFVGDNIQNETFIGMFFESNHVANLVLANGAANCKFFNCTLYQNATSFPACCNVLFTNDDTNPNGFGLSVDNNSAFDTIRHCDFFGGIMEGADIVNNIKTTNVSAIPTGVGGVNSFYSYEFDGKVVMLLDDTYGGITNFFTCGIGGQNDGNLLIDGAGNGAEVFFFSYSHNEAPGGYGAAGADLGIECGNNIRTLLNFNMSNFASVPPYTDHGGITNVDWVPAPRILVVTTVGGGHLDMPSDNAFAIGWRTSTAQVRQGLVRVSISISCVGTVEVSASGSGNILMTLTNTETQQAVYRFRNDDTGTFAISPGVGVLSYQISNFTVEYL